jgi:hypothetical protein
MQSSDILTAITLFVLEITDKKTTLFTSKYSVFYKSQNHIPAFFLTIVMFPRRAFASNLSKERV